MVGVFNKHGISVKFGTILWHYHFRGILKLLKPNGIKQKGLMFTGFDRNLTGCHLGYQHMCQ